MFQKILVFGVVVTVAFFVIWAILSNLGATSQEELTLNNIDNKELQYLNPDTVDKLLPSQPVIAHKTNKNIKAVIANNKYSKHDKLDDFS